MSEPSPDQQHPSVRRWCDEYLFGHLDTLAFAPLCTRDELWAAIEDLDEKAERYGLGLELDGPQDLERATTERKAARAVVRELLGMEAES